VDKGAISIILASECKRVVLTRMFMKINISLKRLLLRNALHEYLRAVHCWVAERVRGMPDSVPLNNCHKLNNEPEPIFSVFAMLAHVQSTVKEIFNRTGIPASALCGWSEEIPGRIIGNLLFTDPHRIRACSTMSPSRQWRHVCALLSRQGPLCERAEGTNPHATSHNRHWGRVA
jgi:hypothetical protein